MDRSGRDPRSGKTTTAPRPGVEAREPVYIYRRWCKGCGLCVEFCPRDVLEMGKDNHAVVARPDQCTLCRLCEALCPDFGISVAKKEKARKEQGGAVSGE